MNSPRLSRDGKSIVIRIPYRFRRAGGRKAIIAPEGADSAFLPAAQPDSSLIKALVRGYRWRGMLERGRVKSLKALAQAEHLDPSYLARTMRLTLLAPDIVTAILEGRQPDSMSLANLRNNIPDDWGEQRRKWGFGPPGQPQA